MYHPDAPMFRSEPETGWDLFKLACPTFAKFFDPSQPENKYFLGAFCAITIVNYFICSEVILPVMDKAPDELTLVKASLAFMGSTVAAAGVMHGYLQFKREPQSAQSVIDSFKSYGIGFALGIFIPCMTANIVANELRQPEPPTAVTAVVTNGQGRN